MKAQETAAAESRGLDQVVEAWLVAATWLLGLQAWRAAVFWLGAGGLRPALAAAVFGGLVLTRWLGDAIGTRRGAAVLLLTLALLRLTVQFVGPGAVLWFAVLGVALFAGALDLHAAGARPQATLHGLLLGLSLVLTDRLLTGGYDLFWQPGGRAATQTCLLLVPVMAIAIAGTLGPAGGTPAPSPLAVLMPLAVPFVQQGLAFPQQVAQRLDTSVTRLGLMLAVATVLAVAAMPLVQYLYALSLRRRLWRKTGYQAYSTAVPAVAAAVALGLMWQPLATTTLLLGPLFLGLVVLAPAAARPVGRVRLSAGWATGLAWWLAAVVSYLAIAQPPLLVIGLVGLSGVALLSQPHPDRAEPLRPAVWPVLGTVPLLIVAIGAAIQAAPPPAGGMNIELADRGVRVATVDLAPGGVLQPERLSRQVRELRDLGARLVLVREPTTDGSIFWDGAGWLARRLDLHCYRLPRREPPLAILAPAPPETLTSPAPDLLCATWRLETQSFGIGFCGAAADPEVVEAATAAMSGVERAVLLGPFGRRPPAVGYKSAPNLTRGDQSAADSVWLGRGVQSVAAEPVVEVHESGVTGLLLVQPQFRPYVRD